MGNAPGRLPALLHALGSPSHARDSLFRVPQDARDLVVEKLEDRILVDAELPTNLEAWARAVERNLHRSGPERRELHRDHSPHLVPETLDTLVAPDPEVYGSCLDPVWLEEFWARLEDELSEVEKVVLRAVLAGGQWRDVEWRCGMTASQVRSRIHRVAEKGRRLGHSFPRQKVDARQEVESGGTRALQRIQQKMGIRP